MNVAVRDMLLHIDGSEHGIYSISRDIYKCKIFMTWATNLGTNTLTCLFTHLHEFYADLVGRELHISVQLNDRFNAKSRSGSRGMYSKAMCCLCLQG